MFTVRNMLLSYVNRNVQLLPIVQNVRHKRVIETFGLQRGALREYVTYYTLFDPFDRSSDGTPVSPNCTLKTPYGITIIESHSQSHIRTIL